MLEQHVRERELRVSMPRVSVWDTVQFFGMIGAGIGLAGGFAIALLGLPFGAPVQALLAWPLAGGAAVGILAALWGIVDCR
jgi:hypothetical protein